MPAVYVKSTWLYFVEVAAMKDALTKSGSAFPLTSV